MGYDNEGAALGWMAFDIETMPRPDAVALVPAVEPEPVDRRLKDPAKIEADQEKKREDAAAKYAAALDKLSLDPNGCQLAAVGIQREGWDAPEVYSLPADERFMLDTFWRIAKGRTIIGFYSRQFDLPVIIQRSRFLRLPIPPWRDLTAPYGRARRCVDLWDELTFDGSRNEGVIPRKLGTFCRLYGLDVPEDETSGADMAALIKAQDYAAVRRHCEVDVIKTVALAEALGVITRQVAGKEVA